jgi:hypothetical protein
MKKFLSVKFLTSLFSFLIIFLGTEVVNTSANDHSNMMLFDREEAIHGWKLMADTIRSHSSGEIITFYEKADSSDPLYASKILFHLSGKNLKSEQWIFNENGQFQKTKIRCANPNYCFVLNALPDNDEHWMVSEMQQQNNEEKFNMVVKHEMSYGSLSFLCVPYSLSGIPLWEIINDKNFSITNILPYEDNTDFVKMQFTWVMPKDLVPNNMSQQIQGDIVFNPMFQWRIERQFITLSTIQNSGNQRISVDIQPEYHTTKEGVSYISIIKTYRKYADNISPVYIAKVGTVSFVPNNEKIFTLSHYGLPEPDFGERRTNRVRYMIIGIGILMMIIGAWRMIRERRKRF